METTQESGEAPVRGTSRWAFLGLAWSVPGLLQYVQEATYSRARGFGDFQPVRELASYLPLWWPWILFTPIVAELTRRLHPRRVGWWRSLLVHAVCAASLGAVHLVVASAYHWLFPPQYLPEGFMPESFGTVVVQSLWSFRSQSEVLAYGVVVAASAALEARRNAALESRRALRLEAQLGEARLTALESQLRPHFLFNALNSCLVLVSEDPARAEVMLRRIAELLRHSLDRDRGASVPLADELTTVQHYLGIEEVRFGERLTLDIDVDDDALDVSVPTWLLQPLVENAVRHGIAKTSDPGRISVRARHRSGPDGPRLTLTVTNSGPARDARRDADQDRRDGASGLGLPNTRERRAAAHGSDASLTLETLSDGVTVATIDLPAGRGR